MSGLEDYLTSSPRRTYPHFSFGIDLKQGRFANRPYGYARPITQGPPPRSVSNPQERPLFGEAYEASKYSRVTLKTIGASRSRPIRLGTAISPFSVSDKFQTKATFTFAKPSAASTHNPR